MNIQKHQLNIRLRKQDSFSKRLLYANKKNGEKQFSTTNIKYKTKEEMISKLERLKGKTKLKTHQDFSNFYDDMNHIRQSANLFFEEDFSGKMHKI